METAERTPTAAPGASVRRRWQRWRDPKTRTRPPARRRHARLRQYGKLKTTSTTTSSSEASIQAAEYLWESGLLRAGHAARGSRRPAFDLASAARHGRSPRSPGRVVKEMAKRPKSIEIAPTKSGRGLFLLSFVYGQADRRHESHRLRQGPDSKRRRERRRRAIKCPRRRCIRTVSGGQ